MTIDELKAVKATSDDNKSEIAIIKNDYINKHNHLTEKIEDLNIAVKDLTLEIKLLLKEINKR